MEIALCIVVWNKSYLKFLLDFTLPTYLASGNLPSLCADWNITFIFATNKEGIREIQSHALYKELIKIGEVIFEDFSREIEGDKKKYRVMSLMHSHLITKCIMRKSVAIMASPDVIITNHSLKKAIQYIKKGKKGVVYPCFLRVNTESVIIKLKHLKCEERHSALPLSFQNITNFLAEDIHLISKSQFLQSHVQNEWRSAQFSMKNNLIFGKSAHLHPYLIDLRNNELKQDISHITLDGGVKECLDIPAHLIHVITDMKEFGALEVSTEKMEMPTTQRTYSNFWAYGHQLLHWQLAHLDYFSFKNYFRNSFWFYLDDKPVSYWKKKCVSMYFFLYNLPGYVYFFLWRQPVHSTYTFLLSFLAALGLKDPIKKICLSSKKTWIGLKQNRDRLP